MIKLPKTFTTTIGDTDLSLEFGRLAPQADVAVMARMGDTCVLTTVVLGDERDLGYFPLSVEYVEKLYAGGRIKASRWVKREGRPSEEAVLKGRLIDRSIRPLFPKSFKRDVQVVCILLSFDGEHSPEILAAIGTSAALHISQIPWRGPISTMRVGYVSEEGDEEAFIINPTEDVQDYSKLDLIVSSTNKKVLMIETMAEQVSEHILIEGIKHAHSTNVQIIEFIESIRKEIGKPKIEVVENEAVYNMKKTLKAKYASEIAILTQKYAARDDDAMVVKKDLVATVVGQNPEADPKVIADAIEDSLLDHVRTEIFEHGKRIDGRKLDEIRELKIETHLLPRTHGSALFQRGLTQVMAVATLGPTSLEQYIETPEGEATKRYIHHYFSPPYSNGETGRMDGPGRREIGHGALAEKAIMPVLPSKEQFPYAIRVVSEVMSSNGSTSMASTCGSSLALMDAGVPIKAAVAGISIGLMCKTHDDYVLLTDIAGIEDFAGYMDFKVAGTATGVTAIQLDVKNDGLTEKMIAETFEAAKKARGLILDQMGTVIQTPREQVSQYAPKVLMLTPPEDKIGEIIGSGGKTIKGIQARTGASIDVGDDGKVTISGTDQAAVDRAAETIKNIYREVHTGEVFKGAVKKILPIGAMVEFLPGRDGLVHVSKMSSGYVRNPGDVVQEGQEVQVKVVNIDERGRVNLTMMLDDDAKDSGGQRDDTGFRGAEHSDRRQRFHKTDRFHR